jgi:hypothetical protein
MYRLTAFDAGSRKFCRFHQVELISFDRIAKAINVNVETLSLLLEDSHGCV